MPNSNDPNKTDDDAVNLIRGKLDHLYKNEPEAISEIKEVDALQENKDEKDEMSKHQKFMLDLSSSGKDLATIQTEWHNYYQSLPDEEKHKVWQEFYDRQSTLNQGQFNPSVTPHDVVQHKHQVIKTPRQEKHRQDLASGQAASAEEIKRDISKKATSKNQLTLKHHFQSLLFGLSMGFIAVFIFLFGFFNEVFIAPFIQPSRSQTNTPIILSTDAVAPSTTPEVIIPKINVEIPIDYSETSTSEAAIENDLEQGVVHYPTTVEPGQLGNAAFFGHSSNNIFNQGKYKFAFVLLHQLVDGDTFYLTYNDKVYVYKVISHKVVSPNDVSVLDSVEGQTATATLITCDPPGTSINRLVVVGQQISPSPTTNTVAAKVTPTGAAATATTLPGNGQTLLSEFIKSTIGKLVIILGICAGAIYIIRAVYRRLTLPNYRL